MMKIGIVTESTAGETRVAATPVTIGQLLKLGYQVVVESGAGTGSGFTDEAYAAAGAAIVDTDEAWGCHIVLAVNGPSDEEIARLPFQATIVGLLNPALDPGLIERLTARTVTALAMDAMPRISRAQSMDVLSSMANIAGYRAVVEATHEFGRFFAGQVTAAGKVPPAKVLVAGAGVAGLAAIGAAARLGAIVRATDPRPEVAEQVTSVGGQYLAVEAGEQTASADGYAKVTSEAYDLRAAELYSEQARDVDIIVTTALIPGRAAPRLITAADVASMKPGSVIVDMAAAQGGNVEGTVPGEKIVTDNGVTIIGYTDLAGRLAAQASQLYGTNLVNLLRLLTPEQNGRLILDLDDVVQRAITATHHGETLWPPPPVRVSAAPALVAKAAVTPEPLRPIMSQRARYALVAVGIAALFGIDTVAPDPLPRHFTVLMLSIVVGYYVIGKVHHALHTPLMSVTNAISGIIVVGAFLQLAAGGTTGVIQILAAAAVLLASINIFGGFAVTRRMLGMFSKG